MRRGYARFGPEELLVFETMPSPFREIAKLAALTLMRLSEIRNPPAGGPPPRTRRDPVAAHEDRAAADRAQRRRANATPDQLEAVEQPTSRRSARLRSPVTWPGP